MTAKQNFDDHVTACLIISSRDLTPSMIASHLGVSPTRQYSIGDARGKTSKYWDHHSWIFEIKLSSEVYEGRSATDLIPIAIERFEKVVTSFVSTVPALTGKAETHTLLGIVSRRVPGIVFHWSFLRLLADLNSTLEIDLITE